MSDKEKQCSLEATEEEQTKEKAESIKFRESAKLSQVIARAISAKTQ